MIGLDFDNTLVDYSDAFRTEAGHLGLPEATSGKTDIRDALRRRPGGEIEWQKLQARVYGPGIDNARLMEGARAFVERCLSQAVPLAIVSHKTRYAAQAPYGTDLREAARRWLDRQSLGIPADRVFFEDTREDKLRRVAELGCAWFVDDLTEVLLAPEFPPATKRLWLTDSGGIASPPIEAAGDWFDLVRHVFQS